MRRAKLNRGLGGLSLSLPPKRGQHNKGLREALNSDLVEIQRSLIAQSHHLMQQWEREKESTVPMIHKVA